MLTQRFATKILCSPCLPCAALIALAAMPAAGAVPHDPVAARGEHIARLVCSACHLVAKDQEFPPLLAKPAPPFSEIANRPGTNAATLQRFITSTHWDLDSLPMSMPNQMLTRAETVAVSQYILSMRAR
ncbi:MAG TPA: c-type cytochrome [Steroidobacteraceae bacterium]|nr:c-type cytochrome [Steroidobacteraceae bacterium]